MGRRAAGAWRAQICAYPRRGQEQQREREPKTEWPEFAPPATGHKTITRSELIWRRTETRWRRFIDDRAPTSHTGARLPVTGCQLHCACSLARFLTPSRSSSAHSAPDCSRAGATERKPDAPLQAGSRLMRVGPGARLATARQTCCRFRAALRAITTRESRLATRATADRRSATPKSIVWPAVECVAQGGERAKSVARPTRHLSGWRPRTSARWLQLANLEQRQKLHRFGSSSCAI